MKDFGYTPPKKEKEEMEKTAISEPEEPQYPSLQFNGQQAEKAGLHECRFGEEYEVTIVSIDGSASYPGSGSSRENPQFSFDVLACGEPKEVGESQEGNDDEKDDKGEDYEEPKNKIELGPPKSMKGKHRL